MPIEIAAAAVQAIKFLYGVGSKVSEVIVDESVMRDLLIPRARLTSSPGVGPGVVRAFFADSAAGQAILAEMDDLRLKFKEWGFTQDEIFLHHLLPVFLSHQEVSKLPQKGSPDVTGYLVVKAYLDGARPVNTPFQRILGEVVNQGLDFLSENPDTLGVNAKVGRVLQPIIEGLAEQNFAEAKYDTLLIGSFGALLGGLQGLAEARIGSQGLKLLTKDLIGSVKSSLKDGSAVEFDVYFSSRGPLLQGLLRTAATTISENPKLYFGKDRALVSGLVLPLVEVIKKNEGDLFTPENGSALLGAALGSLGAQAATLVKIKDEKRAGFVVDLLKDLSSTLSTSVAGGFEDFDVETLFRDLGSSALERVGQNLSIFVRVDGENLNHQLAVGALGATLGALKTALKTPGDVIDQALLTNWMDRVFTAVGDNFALRDEATADNRNSALYQLVGSVARAVGSDSESLLNREGRQELLQIALKAIETQAPVLLDLKNDDLKSNLLDGVLQGVLKAATRAAKGDVPVGQTVLLELVRGTLQGAVEGAVRKALPAGPAGEIVELVVTTILESWRKGSISLDPVLEELPVIVQGALTTTETDVAKFVLAQITPKKGTT